MLSFLYEKIWKDSVFSKLIAELIKHWIITAGAIVGTGVLTFWTDIFSTCWTAAINALLYLIEDPWRIAAVSMGLTVIFLILFLLLRKQAPSPAPQESQKIPVTPIDWFKEQDINKYYFLFWFAARNTLRTERYQKTGYVPKYGDVSFDGIPEIRRLLKAKVLRYEHTALSDYCLEIDDEVLQHLEIHLTKIEQDEETKRHISTLRRMQFRDFFPQATRKVP